MKLSKLIEQLQEMQRIAGPNAEVYKQHDTCDRAERELVTEKSVELITRLEYYLPGRPKQKLTFLPH